MPVEVALLFFFAGGVWVGWGSRGWWKRKGRSEVCLHVD